ncbi:HNH endonuclease [Halapricum desulfuricans]|uniref:Restriction endonuclease, McrA/HNH family n=1 Tax=Halapricum desulfuricans TaxID=2841257 RepID=A0A897NU34_9EURY|nr:HNH endonuclease [Halapricum desulfuricans]QSG16328.1 Restriction endonuclease, McrA/HNH family [Halapricum desulfuricans]
MVDRRRQWRAENQDISIKSKRGKQAYIVSGSEGDPYDVDLDIPYCECKDWEKRSPSGGCKHILKVKIRQGILDPLPSAKTNYGAADNRSGSNYSANWSSLSDQTKERDGWGCQKCGAEGGKNGTVKLQAHHIIPKSEGGQDQKSNLITVCAKCHEEIHRHPIPEGNRGRGHARTSEALEYFLSDKQPFNPRSNSQTPHEDSINSKEERQTESSGSGSAGSSNNRSSTGFCVDSRNINGLQHTQLGYEWNTSQSSSATKSLKSRNTEKTQNDSQEQAQSQPIENDDEPDPDASEAVMGGFILSLVIGGIIYIITSPSVGVAAFALAMTLFIWAGISEMD